MNNLDMRLHEINTLDWDELLVSNNPTEATLTTRGNDALLTAVSIAKLENFLSHFLSFASFPAEQNPYLQQDKQPSTFSSENNVSRRS